MTTTFDIQKFADKASDPSWQQVIGQNIWLYAMLTEIYTLDEALSYGDNFVFLMVENASNVEGDDTNFTVTPAEGKTAADVKVTKNETGHDLNITIGDTVYSVKEDGTLYDPNAKPETDVKPAKTVSLQTKELTPDGKKVTRTLNYVNQNASDAELTTFVRAKNALSENEYLGTTRITKEPIDVPEPATPTTPPQE